MFVDPEGYLLIGTWYDENFQVLTEKQAVLEQTTILHTQSHRLFCPECPRVLRRWMQTDDAGRSWRLVKYEILRPDLMPATARLIMEKVELKVDPQRPHPADIKVVLPPNSSKQ